MARKPDVKRLHQWLANYTREDLVDLITKDFVKHKLPENTAIMFGYRRKVTPPKREPTTAKQKHVAYTGDIQHLERPYTIEEASEIYEAEGQVSGTVRVSCDELIDRLGDELFQILVGGLIDGNSKQLRHDTDIELAGCDVDAVYFNVTCQADPCKNGQPLE